MKKFAYISLMALAVFMPVLVLAQLTDPIIPSSGPIPTLDRIEVILRRIGTFLIMIAIVIAVIVLVWGGINYMTAGGDESKAEKAKTMIWNGIFGAAIVLAVGLILQTLASVLTQTFFGV
jgi:protein-S-isoprenylcysteine O-methyltransferase Ste14